MIQSDNYITQKLFTLGTKHYTITQKLQGSCSEKYNSWTGQRYRQTNAVTSLEAIMLGYVAQNDNEVKHNADLKLRAITIISNKAREKSKGTL